jgi:hypothetical protein
MDRIRRYLISTGVLPQTLKVSKEFDVARNEGAMRC